jgi:nitrous oxidase accessory protein NosD
VVIAAAMLAYACASSTAGAAPARLYVAPNGNDGAVGSLQRPLRTVQRAVDRARPGTTVYVRSGRYTGFRITRSGRPGAPITITIKAYAPGRGPVIRPLGPTTNVIELRRVHDVVLEGLTVTAAPKQWGAGVRIDESSAIRVARMTLVRNRSYGLKAKDSRGVHVTRNRITRNETGVEISGGGGGVVIADNDIYRNDRLIVNDPTPGNDRGANGTVFHKTTGHVRVVRNRIWGNRGPSHDWVHDGGAFEVYAASNLEISHNVVWDNENVMETGTDGSGPCAANRFFRNVAYGAGSLPSGAALRVWDARGEQHAGGARSIRLRREGQ